MCRELEHLRADNKRLNNLIQLLRGVLLDTARYFEEVLRNNNPQASKA